MNTLFKIIPISVLLFSELKRVLGEIETGNFTVLNSEIINLDFTV